MLGDRAGVQKREIAQPDRMGIGYQGLSFAFRGVVWWETVKESGRGGEEPSMGQAAGCACGGECGQVRGVTGGGLGQGREGKMPAASLIRLGPGLTACDWGHGAC